MKNLLVLISLVVFSEITLAQTYSHSSGEVTYSRMVNPSMDRGSILIVGVAAKALYDDLKVKQGEIQWPDPKPEIHSVRVGEGINCSRYVEKMGEANKLNPLYSCVLIIDTTTGKTTPN